MCHSTDLARAPVAAQALVLGLQAAQALVHPVTLDHLVPAPHHPPPHLPPQALPASAIITEGAHAQSKESID